MERRGLTYRRAETLIGGAGKETDVEVRKGMIDEAQQLIMRLRTDPGIRDRKSRAFVDEQQARLDKIRQRFAQQNVEVARGELGAAQRAKFAAGAELNKQIMAEKFKPLGDAAKVAGGTVTEFGRAVKQSTGVLKQMAKLTLFGGGGTTRQGGGDDAEFNAKAGGLLGMIGSS